MKSYILITSILIMVSCVQKSPDSERCKEKANMAENDFLETCSNVRKQCRRNAAEAAIGAYVECMGLDK